MQYRFIAATTALILSSILIDNASAYYSPGLGRFLNRDPIAEPGSVIVRSSTHTRGFIPRDALGKGSPNSYAAFENAPHVWIDKYGLESSSPSSEPAKPIDICVQLGNKGCEGKDIPPGSVVIPVNLLTSLKLTNLCGNFKINKLKNCADNLKYKNLAFFGGKPCDQIKIDVCKRLKQYADGKSWALKCWKQEGDEWIEDPDKECCCKVKFKGAYDVTVPVSLTVPVLPDSQGKNGGSCVITGDIRASLDIEGEFGQCEKKKKE